VKKNIEKLKGKVEIESRSGAGTTFMVRIPMANALTESMLVRAGESRYVIRVSSIRETFRPQTGSITHLPDGSDLIGLRGGLFPVVRLGDSAPHQGAPRFEYDRGLLVLVENHGKQLALYVDEVLGKIQSVIKSPPEMLKSSRTLAGYSIIGTRTDDVAWALDIDAVASKAGLGAG
jgi:two-component system chemotaxis sensor kinase CheA